MGGTAIVVQGFLVEHPAGLVVYDTGLGDEACSLDSRFAPVSRRSLLTALAKLGVAQGDIRAVVNSHLHYDHCGGNRLIPNAEIYVPATEYDLRTAMDYVVPEHVDVAGAHLRLVHDEQELLPGIRIAPTPGHTRGHQSLVIDDGNGPVILAGQAAYSAAEFSDPLAEPARGLRTAWNVRAFVDSIAKLRSLAPRRVHFAHDRGVWQP
jgi:glyoxylase-like metal-dependent hydrolase (beta-lactamase superfamily II)